MKLQIHRALKAYKKKKNNKSVVIALKVILYLGLHSASAGTASSHDSWVSKQQ